MLGERNVSSPDCDQGADSERVGDVAVPEADLNMAVSEVTVLQRRAKVTSEPE